MTADVHSVAAEALEAIAAAQDLAALDAVRARYLGRGDGELTAFRRGLGKIPDPDGRRQMGQMVNELVERVTDAADERQRAIENAARARSLETEALDLTRPAPPLRRGRLNPVTLAAIGRSGGSSASSASRPSTGRRWSTTATTSPWSISRPDTRRAIRRTPSISTTRGCCAPTRRRCRSAACSFAARRNG